MENNSRRGLVEIKALTPTHCGSLEMRWDERTCVMGIINGADIVRVHDVKQSTMSKRWCASAG